MWRRLVSLHRKTLAIASSAPRSSVISASGVITDGSLVFRPLSYLLSSRSFSSDADKTAVKKVEDVMPIATGHEREELEAELQGRNILEIDYPVGPFGTKVAMKKFMAVYPFIMCSNGDFFDLKSEAPAVVKSVFDKRIVGCPGGEGEDEHDVVWFWLKKGEPHECPVCSQYFVLEVVGPGGSPYGHGEEEELH